MENIEKVLDNLIECLKEEKRVIITTLKDNDVDKLFKIMEKKESIIQKLNHFNEKDLKNYKDKLKMIKDLNESNLKLANENIEFIEDIFNTIFEKSTQYTENGYLKKRQDSLINKKV